MVGEGRIIINFVLNQKSFFRAVNTIGSAKSQYEREKVDFLL